MHEPLQPLLEAMRPVVPVLDAADLSDTAATTAALDAAFPYDGPAVAAIRAAAEAAYDAGALTPRKNGDLEFGRVAKDLDGYSIDAVCMHSPGPKHRHPNGEVSLCFVREGDPKFDGHGAGWVVLPPGSAHVPTVKGGTMLILYFLPQGAVEWLEA